jgi:hypothetical protein
MLGFAVDTLIKMCSFTFDELFLQRKRILIGVKDGQSHLRNYFLTAVCEFAA